MDGQLKVCVVEFHSPTQLALYGAKTTTPLGRVAAPLNLSHPLTVDTTDVQLKLCVVECHSPTQSALYGAKTMPLGVVATPPNFAAVLLVDMLIVDMLSDGQLKVPALLLCRARPA